MLFPSETASSVHRATTVAPIVGREIPLLGESYFVSVDIALVFRRFISAGDFIGGKVGGVGTNTVVMKSNEQ